MQPLICHQCQYRPSGPAEGRCPVCGDVWLVPLADHDRAPRDAFLGTELGGKYPILAFVGAGAMGAVYRSRQGALGRDVAVKVVLPGVVHGAAEARARFEQEAWGVAQLDHPAIVTVYDYGIELDGTAFMVMQLLDGQELHDVLRQGGLTARELVQMAIFVLDALHHAHSRGMVHRDIKPGNIMVLGEGAGGDLACPVRVLDFGMVKLQGTNRQAYRTRTGMVGGTPPYMSPEQLGGLQVDGRTDVYSLSLVLWEGLVGRRPFTARSLEELLLQRVRGEAPNLPPLPHVSPELANVVMAGLRRDRDQRFASAQEMARALAGVELGPWADIPLPPFDGSRGAGGPPETTAPLAGSVGVGETTEERGGRTPTEIDIAGTPEGLRVGSLDRGDLIPPGPTMPTPLPLVPAPMDAGPPGGPGATDPSYVPPRHPPANTPLPHTVGVDLDSTQRTAATNPTGGPQQPWPGPGETDRGADAPLQPGRVPAGTDISPPPPEAFVPPPPAPPPPFPTQRSRPTTPPPAPSGSMRGAAPTPPPQPPSLGDLPTEALRLEEYETIRLTVRPEDQARVGTPGASPPSPLGGSLPHEDALHLAATMRMPAEPRPADWGTAGAIGTGEVPRRMSTGEEEALRPWWQQPSTLVAAIGVLLLLIGVVLLVLALTD